MTKRFFYLAVFLASLLGSQTLFSQDCTGKLTISKTEKGGKVYFYAHNLDPWFPIHVKFDVKMTGDLQFSVTLPVRRVVLGGKSTLLGFLTPGDGSGQYSYRYNSFFNYGDPDAVPDSKAVYLFPYEHGVKHGVVQGYFGKTTHQNCRCLDFDLKENSPICAARDGQVVLLRQDSDRGGPGPQFKKDANFIDILHADGTWADYGHLRLNGAVVQLGQWVKAGDIIGYSGHTGEAWGPHLHFEVQKASLEDLSATTIPTLFLQQNGQAVSAVEGKYYYSFHPGGPAFKEMKAEMYTEEALANYSVTTALNGAVTLRTYEMDGQTLFYAKNGTVKDVTFSLDINTLINLTCSKILPCTKVIPAGKEVYLLRLTREDMQSPANFSANYIYREMNH